MNNALEWERKDKMKKTNKETDLEYQGRSKRQVENNYKVVGVSVFGLLITILGIIIYGLLTV